jgi:hypothetical protein
MYRVRARTRPHYSCNIRESIQSKRARQQAARQAAMERQYAEWEAASLARAVCGVGGGEPRTRRLRRQRQLWRRRWWKRTWCCKPRLAPGRRREARAQAAATRRLEPNTGPERAESAERLIRAAAWGGMACDDCGRWPHVRYVHDCAWVKQTDCAL